MIQSASLIMISTRALAHSSWDGCRTKNGVVLFEAVLAKGVGEGKERRGGRELPHLSTVVERGAVRELVCSMLRPRPRRISLFAACVYTCTL